MISGRNGISLMVISLSWMLNGTGTGAKAEKFRSDVEENVDELKWVFGELNKLLTVSFLSSLFDNGYK